MADDRTTIRRATKRDRTSVAELWLAFLEEQAEQDPRFVVAEDARERFENDFPIWVDDDTQRTLVAEQEVSDEEGTLVGFATAHRWGPPPIYADTSEVYIDEFYVMPEARRQGAGRQLAEGMRAWAEELDADRLRLRVLHVNEDGRAFWQALGAAPFALAMTLELEKPGDAAEEEEPRRMGF